MGRLSLIIILVSYLSVSYTFAKTKKHPLQDWAFIAYHGQTAQTIFLKLIRFKSPRPFKTYISSIQADRKLIDFWKERFQIEWAFNLTRRWQKQYQKDFFEFNTYLFLRYQSFPWNRYLYTTLGIGEGFSFGRRVPYIEYHDPTNSPETSKFLNFLSWEISIGTPKCRDWSLVYKLHHRSGIWGMVNNVSGGSNVTAIGIRYTFQNDCATFW